MEIIPNWHPLFVHFTVSLLLLAGALQIIVWFRKPTPDSALRHALKWLLVTASVAVVATVATGLQAYYSVNHDTPSHLAMTDHRNWALATAAVFLLAVAIFLWKPGLRNGVAGTGLLLAAVLVSVTGLKGGELVYRHGLGVMSMPQASGDGHDHDHGEAASGNKGDADDTGGHQHEAGGHQEKESSGTGEHGDDQSSGKTDPTLFTGQDTEAAGAVAAFRRALESGDAELARSMLADDVLIFEGGGVERSADQYASHHMRSDMKFLGQMTITPLEHQVSQVGDMAVSMGRSRLRGKMNGKTMDIETMETLVLHKDDSGWKINQIHWSN